MYVLSLIFKLVMIVGLVWLDYVLIKSMRQGAPFAPTSPRRVAKMVRLAEVKPGDRAADLGAGDGRIVIALARAGAEAHGYETNPLLILIARLRVRRHGLLGCAFIHRQSFWKVELHNFNVITVFGIGYIMDRLGDKLKQELKPGARVVSNHFSLPGWHPAKAEDGILLYQV